MKSYPKQKPYRNPDYLKFIRLHFCRRCSYPAVSAHHVRRSYWGAGTGIKSHDYCTLPWCEENGCHNPKNEKEIDVEAAIIFYLMEYINFKEYDKRELIDVLMAFIEERR